jgi:hypothetical protein
MERDIQGERGRDKLTYRHNGVDRRLTDVHGEVIRENHRGGRRQLGFAERSH